MSTSEQTTKRINDFVIKVGTVNGTGSASANGLLMKAIFRMGVPVVGKNVFPSNIQGLPTWYEIRVTEDGYAGRSGDVDIMVAMNAETYERDLASLSPGGVLLYDSSWPRPHFMTREDVTVVGVPLSKECNKAFTVARSRILMKNMAYVGAIAAMINLDMDVIKSLVEEMFARKAKLVPANMQALEIGFNAIKDKYPDPFGFKVEASDKTLPVWDASMAGQHLELGTRLRRQPRSWIALPDIVKNFAKMKTAQTNSVSFKRRTNWRPQA